MAPPRALPEVLVEDILLRFPPDDPARLVHAALVCKPWCAIVSGAGFRRRFREFHRTPPLLGFVSNVRTQGEGEGEFVPTCSWPAPPVYRRVGRVVDAHHGRVLLHRVSNSWAAPWSSILMVWDPTTNEQEEVLVPNVRLWWGGFLAAAVLCAAGSPCNHLDCRRGPFLIIFVGYTGREIVLCTYSSSTASWSNPISSDQLPLNGLDDYNFTEAAHVQSALYFGVRMSDHILKFDLESQEMSWIQLPTACCREWSYVLTTTESGGLGVAAILESSKLYMWSRDDVSEEDAIWTQSRVIDLKTLLLFILSWTTHLECLAPQLVLVSFLWSRMMFFLQLI